MRRSHEHARDDWRDDLHQLIRPALLARGIVPESCEADAITIRWAGREIRISFVDVTAGVPSDPDGDAHLQALAAGFGVPEPIDRGD